MKQVSTVPKAINITLSSLPYFLETSWEWEGALEITEWGPRQYDIFRLPPIIIPKIKERGMQIWVDDIPPSSWLQWKFQKMDGYKISLDDFKDECMVERFINEIKKRHKPIILEWIDQENLISKARGWGINLGQGLIFEKNVKFANTY